MAKKDKKAEAKVTKLEVNPKEENATPETNEVPVADPSKEIVESSIPENFVGGHSSKDNTSVTEPLPVWTDGEIKDSASELKDPEFHESEPEAKPSEIANAPSRPRYHRQDVVNIAQVVYEAQKALATTEGDNSYKGWDNEDDNRKTELIGYIDTVLTENDPVIVDKKTVKLTHAIVNALK